MWDLELDSLEKNDCDCIYCGELAVYDNKEQRFFCAECESSFEEPTEEFTTSDLDEAWERKYA